MDQQESQDHQARMDILAVMERRDLLETLDHLEFPDCPDLWVHKDSMDQQESQDHQARMDNPVVMERRDLLENLDHLEFLDCQDGEEKKVYKAL